MWVDAGRAAGQWVVKATRSTRIHGVIMLRWYYLVFLSYTPRDILAQRAPHEGQNDLHILPCNRFAAMRARNESPRVGAAPFANMAKNLRPVPQTKKP